MATRKISATKNYALFNRSNLNRETEPKKHRRLVKSMQKYGFLPCFPIVCRRDESKQLVIKDGQHRFAIAESLGLPIHWVEEDTDFDIAEINTTGVVWSIKDYARMHAENGLKAYQDGIEFAETHGLPLGVAFAMLGGTTSFTNVHDSFVDGSFKVKDRRWADAVAGVYVPMIRLSAEIRNARFLQACMAVCRVEEFDAKRLIQNASRVRDKLVSYSTRDAYLTMLEEVYNFGRTKLCGLKAAATMVMRDRAPCKPGKRKAEAA